ncbi:MAG: hypothetical protein JSW04_13770 [Desulfobacterales bacterium]|nr:MAG: hypothetical protein JSW04_13770 [Desulfobacterales bacterium]
MYEIVANPENYEIGALKEGLGYNKILFPDHERKAWAGEIGTFTEKLVGLSEKAKELQQLLMGEDKIVATPASLKTLKIQLFKINDALVTALDLAGTVEKEIVKK